MSLFRIILLIWTLTASAGVCAQPLAVRDLGVLVDPGGALTIAEVSSAAARESFTPLAGMLNAGYTRDVQWLRFSVAPPAAGEWWLEVQPPFLDDLRLFEPDAGGFVEHRSGDRQPFVSREEDYRAFVFKLTFPDAAPRTLYLRVQTTSTAMVALHVWRPDQFSAAKYTEYGALGLYYGFIVLVLLLNLILWAWLREALYGWFCLHIFTNILLFIAANGFVGQYLLPETPLLADAWVGAALLITIAASAPFYRRMLRVDKTQSFIFLLFRLQVALPTLLLLSLFTGYYPEAARIAISQMLFSQLVGLFVAYRMWRAGRHEAPYILLALVSVLLGGVTSALVLLGVNPSDLLSLNIRQLTVLGNILAMHFALAIRIRVMLAERRQTLQRAHDAEADAAREREAHTEQGRFIAMLSHELKTPLAVIDVAAQALERMDRAKDPERARRHERIRRSVNRIDRLVEQFLTKDRLDARGISLQRSSVDVGELLHQVADTSADGAERLMLAVFSSPPLQADGALLRLAVANLVDNALKYAPPETHVAISVMTRTEHGAPGVEIIVADEGPGIPAELEDKVFSRYIRGSNVQHVSGAGLGLYLVRRIAELHGGFVELSPHSSGAVFRLWLPLGESRV